MSTKNRQFFKQKILLSIKSFGHPPTYIGAMPIFIKFGA